MNNVIIIIKNKDNFMSPIFADDYLAIGRSGERLEMITNLKPQDLLILLMPIVEELLEELHYLVLD